MNIPFILEKALSLYPDKEAVVCGKKRFTYQQFAERVYRLANFLGSAGVGRGDCIAILHQNSYEFLESYFAVAQLRAILNPLNFRLSPRELSFILKDSGATLLITSSRFGDQVQSLMEMKSELNQIIWTGLEEIPKSFESVRYEEVLRGESDIPPPTPDISDDDVAHLRAE